MIVVVMGVSGCGKSTVGAALARRLGGEYLDADAFHPPANVAKMRRGEPLDDADRRPWLAAIAARIDELRVRQASAVIGCSALRRAYRDILIGKRAGVRLVYLRGDRETIARRLAARAGHFMPPTLLESQFAALEEPTPDERPISVDVDRTPTEIVEIICDSLARDRA